MAISRPRPPVVRQRMRDSCWAAVLESWSQADRRVSAGTQDDLVALFGNTTGGITPATHIPLIASQYGLAWGGFQSGQLGAYLNQHLAASHIFCAYARIGYHHSILIYRLANDNVSYMDPDPGRYRTQPLSQLEVRGPFALMRAR